MKVNPIWIDVIFVLFVGIVLSISFFINIIVGIIICIPMGLLCYGYVSTIIKQKKIERENKHGYT